MKHGALHYQLRLVGACVSVLIILSSSIVAPITALADTETPAASPTTLNDTTISNTPILPNESTQNNIGTTVVEPSSSPGPSDTTLSNSLSAATTATQQTQSGDAAIVNTDNAGNSATGTSNSDVTLLNKANNLTSLGGSVAVLDATPTTNQNYTVSPQQSNEPSVANLPTDSLVIQNDSAITNVVSVDSVTGNITATYNDSLGDITTGDAISSVAILNLANNIVATGDIFVGTITLDDNYKNNIILSDALLNHLINGTGRTTEIFNGTVTTESLQVVTNSVNASAKSGNINASFNDTVGNVKTGDATTNIDISDTTGSYVIFGNALLVIVTTTGTWSGNMIDSPGSYIALITLDNAGNPTLITPVNSDNLVSNLRISNKSTITNTVSASATSGNVTAYKNDDIGDITTGDATVNITIRNVLTNIVSFSDWFGVLFINVFGDWSGNVVMQQKENPNPAPYVSTAESASPPPISQYETAARIPYYGGYATSNSPSPINDVPQTIVASATQIPFLVSPENISDNSALWILIVTLIGGSLFAGQQVFTIKQASL